MPENDNNPLEMRDAFGQTLVELGAAYPNMVMLDADLNTSSKAVYFKKAYPDRFIQVGIAEQNLFGISAGLALTGFIPFPSTFAVFAARRALDQIAISICYPNLNVKIPGSYVGVPTSRAGASHNCIEDIAVMRALPNMKVADAGDNADLRAIMHTAMKTEGPVYFRVTRYTLPVLFGPGHTFAWGKGELLREGADVTLFGTGLMTGKCMAAAEILAKDGIPAEVIHLASIKPIDRALIAQSVRKTGCAVTAENATIVGGFGAAVAEALGDVYPVPLRRIGVQDQWLNSGGVDALFELHKMQPPHIAAAARAAIQAKLSPEAMKGPGS
ncbi:MAG: transketolase family protein [Anaerolineae bacterium]|nr:transketolase family protein [Anaerolineae bacterium]